MPKKKKPVEIEEEIEEAEQEIKKRSKQIKWQTFLKLGLLAALGVALAWTFYSYRQQPEKKGRVKMRKIGEIHEEIKGPLGSEQQKWLLEEAVNVIETVTQTGEMPDIEEPKDPALTQKSGAFVTISKDGQLRGCIGFIEAMYPLYQSVAKAARSAACQDPRFYPVQENELPKLQLEISILYPSVKVVNIEEIKVGRDGLIIRQDPYQGLLLPQVAMEYNWDREQFLEQTCVKAGLPRDAWQKGAEIWRFEAQVFGEK